MKIFENEDGSVYNLDNAVCFKVKSIGVVGEVYAIMAIYGLDFEAVLASGTDQAELHQRLKTLLFILSDSKRSGVVAVCRDKKLYLVTDENFAAEKDKT